MPILPLLSDMLPDLILEREDLHQVQIYSAPYILDYGVDCRRVASLTR
jgi:hypothetical protein